ncbi:MAG: ATP-binding protein [Adlercreutzia sp.]
MSCSSPTEGLIISRDNGCGIPAEQLDRVFDRFVSAPHSETTSEGGTGLGLSIVRNFSAMMGGDVSVKSVEGEGSCFTVELPLPAIPDEVEENEDVRDMRISLTGGSSADRPYSSEGGDREPS